MVDQRCRESNGKAKIEGYTRVSDEQAHQQIRRITSFMTSTLGSGGGRPRYVTQAPFMIVAKLIRFLYRKQWRPKKQEL